MRSLAVLAILFLGVAYGHHSPEHRLQYPGFLRGTKQQYELWINVTAGVPGMHSQVSKSAIWSRIHVYPKSEKEFLFQAERVQVTNSLSSVQSRTDPVELKRDRELEKELERFTRVSYENGKVKEYTLYKSESLQAQKIRKAILRSFEIEFDEQYLGQQSSNEWPITYNKSQTSEKGEYYSHYVVTASPDVEYPNEQNIFNITRVDDYEQLPYPAYRSHHNFDRQGCPGACKKSHSENQYGAGCPAGHEPYNTPLKRSYVQQYNLKYRSNQYVFDTVRTKESHLADVYDQNMELTFETEIQLNRITKADLPQTPEQGDDSHSGDDLHQLSQEIEEQRVSQKCKFPDKKVLLEAVPRLLGEIADIVIENNMEKESSKQVGEKILSIKKSLQYLKEGNLQTLNRGVKSYQKMSEASEKDKIIRQVWLDILPTIGTPDSVSWIVKHIKNNINLSNKDISFWESKAILESLPQNIHHPTAETIRSLSELLEAMEDTQNAGYNMFYSAAHMAVARVIRNACASQAYWSEEDNESMDNHYRFRFLRRSPRQQRSEEDNQFQAKHECPKSEASQFIQDVTSKLSRTASKAKRVIYIETLARTGLGEVLPTLRPYLYAEHGESVVRGLSQSYVDFLKAVTTHTLHNIAPSAPREVQDLLLPLYYNTTEPPKVRTAAFGVILQSQPSLSLLQQLATHSWQEPSEEVANYVTSSLETFGNSSSPCQQLTASRIRKALPLFKRVDQGPLKAKNIIVDFWNELGRLGFERHFDYTPSNESFIPSVIYGALGYNMDTLQEYFFQYALNIQGPSSHNFYDAILKHFGLSPASDIPQGKQQQIFDDLEIVPRDPEFWRITSYLKVFYSMSYYYFDADTVKPQDIQSMWMDLLQHYIKRDSDGYVSGHLVKVLIPSSYHSKSISDVLPYPLEYEMSSPLLLSLKLRVKKSSQSRQQGGVGYEVEVRPSVYKSIIYINDALNVGDCKRIGVYHEQRKAYSYPFVVSFQVQNDGSFSFSYKFPELPKSVFSLSSEAGTYSGNNFFVSSRTGEKKAIKTIPAQFEKTFTINVPGLPNFKVDVKSEDIQYGMALPVPNNWYEAADYFFRRYLNSGWRQLSIDITREADSQFWTENSEVSLQMNYLRQYISDKSESGSKWYEGLNFDDNLNAKDTSSYAREGQRIYKTLSEKLNHVKDSVEVSIEHQGSSKTHKMAEISLYHLYTYSGFLHAFHMNATASPQQSPNSKIQVTGDYAMAFVHRPNEFQYSKNQRKQKGLAIGGLSFCKSTPFLNPQIVTKAVFNYKPLSEVLHFTQKLSEEHFSPDTHEECLRDEQQGDYLSPACQKSIRENSIYNHVRAHALWSQDSAEPLYDLAENVDLALKAAFYNHMHRAKKQYSPSKHGSQSGTGSLHLEATYIDKMTDEPVLDIVLDTPSETVTYSKLSAGYLQPVSSIENLAESYAAAWTNNTYPATCAITNEFVRTYDMKTYRMADNSGDYCTYVLSTHCTSHKKFAVLVKYNNRPQQGNVKQVQIYVGTDEVTVNPGSRSQYDIEYKGRKYSVKPATPVMLSESSQITAVMSTVSDGSSFIEIQARKAGLKVSYDSHSVKVQVHPRYKGELCGLCSEFNGESAREYRGVDRCLYEHSDDFARSAIVGQCNRKSVRTGSKICSNDEVTYFSQRRKSSQDNDDDDDDESTSSTWSDDDESWTTESWGRRPTTKRNMVMPRGSHMCFSTKPVPVCDDHSEPSQTEDRDVDFHCLPKLDASVRKMVTESKRRILGEMETKTVDYTESIQIAKMC